MLVAACVVGIVYVIAYFAVSVKRLHDRDLSAWWLSIFWLLPLMLLFAGSFVVAGSSHDRTIDLSAIVAFGISGWSFIEFFCLRGTVGDNRFGPDPLVEKAGAVSD